MSSPKSALQDMLDVIALCALIMCCCFFTFAVGANIKGENLTGLMLVVLIASLVIGGNVYRSKRKSEKKRNRAIANRERKLQQAAQAERTRRRALYDWQKVLDMDGFEFEHFVSDLLKKRGYQTRVGEQRGDHGVDVTAKQEGYTTVVQCKHYAGSNKAIGEPALRDLYGTMADTGADYGMFVTTTHFSKPAKVYAQNKPIELVDKRKLQKWIDEKPKEQSQIASGLSKSDLQNIIARTKKK